MLRDTPAPAAVDRLLHLQGRDGSRPGWGRLGTGTPHSLCMHSEPQTALCHGCPLLTLQALRSKHSSSGTPAACFPTLALRKHPGQLACRPKVASMPEARPSALAASMAFSWMHSSTSAASFISPGGSTRRGGGEGRGGVNIDKPAAAQAVLLPPCPALPCARSPRLCTHPWHPQAYSPTQKLWPGRAASASRSGEGSTATGALPARRAASCASNCTWIGIGVGAV